MAFQFLHIDTVSRSVPKKAVAKRWSLADVLAEAGRVAAACPHIENPQPPKRLFGVPLRTVGEAVVRRADEARDASGRKLRKDAPVMLAGVLSYPVSVAEMNEQGRADYARWEDHSLRWLRSRFGDGLASVVRHTDEAFPHIHFFVIPEVTAARTLDMEALHSGIAAREIAKRAGKTTKEANRAYCEAMRGLQDDFHAHVGVFHGHLREGPRRRRLSRGAYLAERREAGKRSVVMTKVEADLAELERLKLEAVGAAEVKHRAQLLTSEVAHLRKENEALSAEARERERTLKIVKRSRDDECAWGREVAWVAARLIEFVLTGAQEKIRRALLSVERPRLIDAALWERLQRRLNGAPSGFARTRKRSGFERD